MAIDGFNSFFYPLTRLNTPTKKTVKPEEVTLTGSFKELTKNNWVHSFFNLPHHFLASILMISAHNTNYSVLSSSMLFFNGFQTNGVILLTADQLALPDDHQENHFPRYLLHKEVTMFVEY